ncbi:MAG: SAM-dependent methyltransferase [Acidobacteriota bacterium]
MNQKRRNYWPTIPDLPKFYLIFFLFALFLLWGCGKTKENNLAQKKLQAEEKESLEQSPEELPEITIRNVTDGPVIYKIDPRSDNEEPQKITIQAGEVHRYPTKEDMHVFFPKGNIWIRYTLDKGQPFSFRYDENNELELYIGSHGREDAVDLAPYVATPLGVVETMLDLAEIKSHDVVYDIGCGDGRIVIMAAKRFGARGVGIELDPKRLKEARRNAREAGVEDLVEFRRGDATQSDYSEATVVTMYLLPESNKLLRPVLEKQLRDGARVVSHNYDIPGWEDREIIYQTVESWDGEEHSIYVYKK